MSEIVEVPVRTIRKTAEVLFKKMRISAIKIGMLHTASTVDVVAEACRRFAGVPLVLDPVIQASDGTDLIDDNALETMVRKLFPLADLVTPNAPEAQRLTGVAITDKHSTLLAAKKLLKMGVGGVVIKGGHLQGDATDTLVTATLNRDFTSPRIQGPPVHGTGCAFSAALAANLAIGLDPEAAVWEAKRYVGLLIKRTNEKKTSETNANG